MVGEDPSRRYAGDQEPPWRNPGAGPGPRASAQSRVQAGWTQNPAEDASDEWRGQVHESDRRAEQPRTYDPPPGPNRTATNYPPSPEPPSDLPREGQRVRVRGMARAVQQRTTGSRPQMEMLQFRIERYDESGNRLPRLQVEMRSRTLMGSRISGQLSDNDEVEVDGVWQSGVLQTQSVLNLSTGAHLRNQSDWDDFTTALSGESGKKIRKGVWIAIAAVAAAVTVLVSTIAILIVHANSSFNESRNDNLRSWCMDVRDMGGRLPHECDGLL